MNCTPGPLNSNLIKTEKAVPNSPENNANIKYNVPISLAFEDKNHLSVQSDIDDLRFIKLCWCSIGSEEAVFSSDLKICDRAGSDGSASFYMATISIELFI